jgi:hypothetical protein
MGMMLSAAENGNELLTRTGVKLIDAKYRYE